MVLACARGNALLAADELPGNQREKVAWFLVRIDPLGEMAPFVAWARQIALLDKVAIREQHGIFDLVCSQNNGVTGHHIRPIQEVRDAPKPFRFTLREKRVVADVQTHQLGVFDGLASREDFQIQRRGAFWQIFEHEIAAIDFERRTLSVDQHPRQIEIFTVQSQRLCRHTGVAPQSHFVEYAGFGRIKVKTQLYRVNQPGGRGVGLTQRDGRGSFSIKKLQHLKSPKSSYQ